jgi:hypothetical protein
LTTLEESLLGIYFLKFLISITNIFIQIHLDDNQIRVRLGLQFQKCDLNKYFEICDLKKWFLKMQLGIWQHYGLTFKIVRFQKKKHNYQRFENTFYVFSNRNFLKTHPK